MKKKESDIEDMALLFLEENIIEENIKEKNKNLEEEKQFKEELKNKNNN